MPGARPARWDRAWIDLLACLALFTALRARWVGHLLIWDEALEVAAIRAVARGVRDAYSASFVKHGPLYPLLAMLLSPARPGFAERVEALSIAISALNLVLLFLLNRRLFGRAAALFSVLLLAVMPGAVLFDVWIKRDVLAVTFSLAALLALARGAPSRCGLALGLAFLAKATAIFHALGIGALALLGAGGSPRRDLAKIAGLSAVVSGWWYLIFAFSGAYYWHFVFGSSHPGVHVWSEEPRAFYAVRAWRDLGAVPLGLALAGCAITARLGFEKSAPRTRLWPLAVLIPSYALLTASSGKAIWLVSTLNPAWATLGGVALAAIWQAGRAEGGLRSGIPWAIVMGIVAVSLGARSTLGRSYVQVLEAEVPTQAWGAVASRDAAEALNARVPPDGVAIATPFHYWAGSPIPDDPDPIFVHYLRRDIRLVTIARSASAPEIVERARREQAACVLVSTRPSEESARFLNDLSRALGKRPVPIRNGSAAVLFEVRTP